MPLGPATFPCPLCQTPLRIADLAGGDRQFDCPECRRPLELRLGDEGAALRPMTSSAAMRRPERVGSPSVRRWTRLRTIVSRRELDPLTITWLVAGIVTASLLFALARERNAGDAGLRVGSPANVRPIADAPLSEEKSDTLKTSPDSAPAPRPVTVSTERESVTPATSPRDDLTQVATTTPPRPPVIAEKPIAPPAADLRREIETRLAQRVVLFEQATPVVFDTLRLQLSELASVPIEYDDALGADPPQRTTKIQVSLDDSTLADVLDAIAGRVGLDYEVDRAGIRLIERTSAAAASELPQGDSE